MDGPVCDKCMLPIDHDGCGCSEVSQMIDLARKSGLWIVADEIERLTAIESAALAVLDDMEVGNWSQYKQDALATALNADARHRPSCYSRI